MPTESKNPLQQLLESGIQFTEMSRKQAESAVRSFFGDKPGEPGRSDVEAAVQKLLERGRETTAQFADAIQQEVAKQLGWLANRVDDVEDQLERFVSRLGASGGDVAGPSKATARPAAPAKKSAAKKSAAKKSAAAKRSPAAKKASAAKKAPAKKSPAKRSTTAKKAPAKKSPAKKRAATKQTTGTARSSTATT